MNQSDKTIRKAVAEMLDDLAAGRRPTFGGTLLNLSATHAIDPALLAEQRRAASTLADQLRAEAEA